jgi:hypothetical protein
MALPLRVMDKCPYTLHVNWLRSSILFAIMRHGNSSRTESNLLEVEFLGAEAVMGSNIIFSGDFYDEA